MKVYVKNKMMTIGGSSYVVDENNNPVFTVKGKVFSFTKKKIIYSASGEKLFTVRNKLISFFVHKTYIYDAGKNKIASVQNRVFKKEFVVNGYKDEITVEGKFFSLTCQILKNGEVAGIIRRQFASVADAFRDSFELEASEEELPFLVALVISIDNIGDRISG